MHELFTRFAGRPADLTPNPGTLKSSGIGFRTTLAASVLSALFALSFIQASPAVAHDRPGKAASSVSASELFGSVPLRFGPIRSAPWQRLHASDSTDLAADCAGSDGICDTALGRDVVENRARRLDMPLLEMVHDINSSVNRAIRYRSDREAYGKVDYWASFEETARSGTGDCEDYAIAKMWILEQMGVPLSAMRLVVLLDSRLGRYHAVLALRSGEEWLVLDNATDRIERDANLAHYIPVYSLSASGSWIHGFRPSGPQISLQSIGSIYPGEAHKQ